MRGALIVSLLVATLFPSPWAHAQESVVETDPPPLGEWNERRLATTATGMQILTGWALANIAVGITGWAVSDDDRWRNFHLMNAGWNTVNLALGGSGWWGAATADPASFDLKSSIEEVVALENLLLFNAGLDVAYIVGGSALWWAGDERNRDDWSGWGQSIALQGAFLLAFDLALWAFEKGLRDELLEDYWAR